MALTGCYVYCCVLVRWCSCSSSPRVFAFTRTHHYRRVNVYGYHRPLIVADVTNRLYIAGDDLWLSQGCDNNVCLCATWSDGSSGLLYITHREEHQIRVTADLRSIRNSEFKQDRRHSTSFMLVYFSCSLVSCDDVAFPFFARHPRDSAGVTISVQTALLGYCFPQWFVVLSSSLYSLTT